MRSALRRELSRTGLQILGLLLGLLVMLLLGFLYGHHIEGQVGEVAKRQHRDHRHIVAIERGHPLGGDALQPPSTGGQQHAPSTGGAPGHSGENFPHGGAPSPEQPPSPHIPESGTPPSQPPPVSEAPHQPGLVESVGTKAGGTVEGVTTTVCTVSQQLLHTCP